MCEPAVATVVLTHISVTSNRHRSRVAKRRQLLAGDGNPRCVARTHTFSAEPAAAALPRLPARRRTLGSDRNRVLAHPAAS